MDYAVVKTGGKQYRVSEGDEIEVEKIALAKGAIVDFDEILMLKDKQDIKLGNPLVKNARVKAKVVSQFRGGKIRVARFRRRKRSCKVKGHRQYLTKVKITNIINGKN